MSRTHVGITLIIVVVTFVFGFVLAGAQVTRASAARQPETSPLQQGGPGQEIYETRCAVCHGSEGDGGGPAADNFDPRPRDFRRGWYKIRTTESGQLPTDEDIIQIIADGMPGTTMPAWSGILGDDEIREVALYIKSFASRFDRETPAVASIGAQVASSPESIARGAELYAGADAGCVKCHGSAGRGDGPSANELTEDAFGDVIVPADLTMPWLFRGGATVEDIYLRIETGLTGSPMPAYGSVLSDDQLWDVANYVDSLGPDDAPEFEPAITASRIEGAIPGDAGAEAWQNASETYYPFVAQIMREPRNTTASVAGVWVRALHNGNELALLLRWHDRFHDISDEAPVDAFAVQFPAELPDGDERPYFVFGDSSNAVNLWHWSADINAVEERSGRGAGSISAQATQNVNGSASFTDGEYTLIVRRALNSGDGQDIQIEPGRFIPIAFMAWDGWRGEEGAAGAITTWYQIILDEPVPVTNFIWIPVAIVVTALLEVWVVRSVRRSAARRDN